MKKKLMAVALATIIAVTAIAGASLAWLKDTTETVTNTFTEGLVDIELTESETVNNKRSYKMVPGDVLSKDPKVTVLAASEKCWLFVKVEEGNAVGTFLTYEIADGWQQLEDGVYYRIVEDAAVDQPFYVLKGDTANPNGIVTVNTNVDMDDMRGLTSDTYPELKFTAYAIQYAHFDAADTAWAEIIKVAQ